MMPAELSSSPALAIVTDKSGTDYVGAGLTASEAAARLQLYGLNEMPGQAAAPWWRVFGRQFNSIFVGILAIAAAASALLREFADAIAISAILLLNAVLGFVQEYRAERGLAALRRLCAPVVAVWRDSQRREIASLHLVPGDICFLQAGMVLPADGELLEGAGILVDESVLTGESEGVPKSADAGGDRALYAGSRVHKGKGRFIVNGTGARTRLGEIASLVDSVPERSTPMQRQLARFTSRVTLLVSVVVTVFFAASVYAGISIRTMFLTSVSMAVAALPEGLPAVITIVLALSAQRLLRRNVLVRRLPAIETLGAVTAICSDKTGTLTENRITLKRLWSSDGQSDMSVADIARSSLKKFLLLCGVLCNEAQPACAGNAAGDEWTGDPVDIALIRGAAMCGIEKQRVQERLRATAEFPFDAARRAMTTFLTLPASLARAEFGAVISATALPEQLEVASVEITKGAPEVVFAASDRIVSATGPAPFTAEVRVLANHNLESLTEAGFRVLAIAARVHSEAAPPDGPSAEGMTLVGLVAFHDPPRPDSASALETCRTAGIRALMITGDHPATARGVAAQLGFETGAVLHGDQIAAMSGQELSDAVAHVSIYARMKPEHKLLVVRALQDRGEIVAATGDGVNDAPCLTAADVGIAMGMGGTDVARDASTIILRDNSFASIAAGIREGRVFFANVEKFILYLLICNSAELCVMLLAPLAGMHVPLSPVQILWMNLVTDSLPALALGVAPGEPSIMEQPPRDRRRSIISKSMALSIVFYGLLMTASALAAGYVWIAVWPLHWKTALFTTITVAQLFFALGLNDRRAASVSVTSGNRSLVAAVLLTCAIQLLAIYTAPLQAFLRTQPLSLPELMLCASFSLVPLVILQWRKRLERSEL